jgi:SNF2 family DNA or RNA helicase
MRIIDHGESLGETLELFRSAFFNEVENPFSMYPDYVFRKKEAPVLNRIVAHRSIEYEANAADLPKLVSIIKPVALPKDSETQYEALKQQFKNALESGGPLKQQVIQSHFLAMRQLSSGFLGYTDDDDGIRAQLEFDDNPKLELLKELCVEISPKYKMIVFCEFTFSGSMICRELDRLKIEHTRIYGGTKDQSTVLDTFKHKESCRILVLNNTCGGFGLNLQIAKYGIYFESPISPIMRKQTRRRIERQGSEHDRVFIYDLVVRDTMDLDILRSLEAGKNLLEEVIRGRSSGTRVRL